MATTSANDRIGIFIAVIWSYLAPSAENRVWRAPDGDDLRPGIGRAILVHEPAVGVGAHHVDVGASGDVRGMLRADFEVDRHRAGSVVLAMAVAGAFRKGRAIAGPQHRLATIFDQRQLAFEHIDEFVFM